MALNPQFPNYANGPAGTEVIGWTVVGGHPLYRLPNASVNLSFGFGLVALGSTLEAPTFPQGVYAPDPNITNPGTIIGALQVGQTIYHTASTVTGTAPITVGTLWIRSIGGKQTIVGSGTSYVLSSADIGAQIIVRTTATNSLGTVESQTVPYGPVLPTAPVITNAGTITSQPPNPSVGTGGMVSGLTLTNGGSGYIYLLGAPDVTIAGDGTGATATATLAEEGPVVAINASAGTGTNGTSGTVTYSGEGSETDIVLNWSVGGSGGGTGPLTFTLVDGGSGWTQANAAAAEQLTYGTRVVTGPAWTIAPNIGLFVGVPIAALTLTNGGSGYTTAGVTITPVTGDTYGSGATATATIAAGGANVIYPTQTAVFSGPTVTGNSPQVSWVWGYGSGPDFQPIQLGGLTFSPVPASAVGKEIFVRVTATNLGGTVTAFSDGIEVDGSAPQSTRLPRIGPQEVVTGDTVTGEQGRWSGYPTPLVTDWGFAYLAVPTPTPIAGANKVYTYKTTQADEGQRIVFYVTAENSQGSTTAYSLATDAVYDTLTPRLLPTLTGFQSPAQYGDVLRGTPGTFEPVGAYQYSYFAYVESDGSLTEIAGTQGTTTYTIGTADLGKQIVYASYGTNTGKYGTEEQTTRSTSTGTCRRFLKVVSTGTITYGGAAPLIGSTAQAVAGVYDPPVGTEGVQLNQLRVCYAVKNGMSETYQYFINQSGGWTSPRSFTVPAEADGWPLLQSYSATYQDYPGAIVQNVGVSLHGRTPPVEGVAPFINTPPDWAPGNVFAAGQTLTYVPGTWTGVPDPTVTWVWYLASNEAGTDKVMVQNGGLTYTLPDDCQGKWVSIVETARNQAGSMLSGTGPDQISGPLPVWTRQPVITGSPLMTPTQGTTLNGIPPLARDPITGGDADVSWDWYVQYPGQAARALSHPFPTYNFLNENGKWTGAEVFIRGTATNAIGTVTTDSNRIKLQGTPRILSDGVLGTSGFGVIWQMCYTAATSDGGNQTVASYYTVVATVGGETSGFAGPTAGSCSYLNLLPSGAGVASVQQTLTNDQGVTTFSITNQSFQKF